MAVGCEQIIFKINFHVLCRISNLLNLLNYHTEQIQAFAKVLASGGYTEKFQVTKLDMRHFSNMEIFLNKYTKIFP